MKASIRTLVDRTVDKIKAHLPGATAVTVNLKELKDGRYSTSIELAANRRRFYVRKRSRSLQKVLNSARRAMERQVQKANSRSRNISLHYPEITHPKAS